MFTSEPSLAQRIERMIDATPIVDAYSRIDPRSPVAYDLITLVAERPLLLALRGAGYRGAPADLSRPENERIAEVLPYLPLVKTTAAGWCFGRILRDLYDFTDTEITAGNLPVLIERIRDAANDPAWPTFVLEKRARLTQLVTGLPASDLTSPLTPLSQSGLVSYRLDLATYDEDDNTQTDAETIRRAVFDQLDHLIEVPVRVASLTDRLKLGHPVHDAILHWHQLHEAPLQVQVVSIKPIGRVSVRYPGVRLCVLTSGDDLLNHPASWHSGLAVGSLLTSGLAPSRFEAQTLDRIERLPTSRIMGFASGMATAEWTYGAYVLARRATAAALSRAVVGGYFEEDEIPPLCRAIFHDSPRRWLRLED